MAHREHCVWFGQSLARGLGGGTTISLAAEYANAKEVLLDGSLVELKTTTSGTGGLQRPGLSAGYRFAAAHPTAIAVESTHAVNGTGLAALSKGGSTGKYEEAVATELANQSAAAAGGDTSEVISIHLQQGERDQGADNTPAPVYVQMIADWFNNFKIDTNQPNAIFVTCQTATWKWYNKPFRIGGAQLTTARTLPGVYIVGGQYQLASSSDGLHLQAANGYYPLGELHARVVESVRSGAGWKPFAPRMSGGYSAIGTSLVVTFDVPVGSLVFDTTTVPAMTDMGFSLASTDAQIMGVAITAPNQITITLDRPLDPDTYPQLGYGVKYSHATFNPGCGLGNLRDSDPRVSARNGSALFNWSCQFEDRIFGVEPPPDPEPSVTTAFQILEAFHMGDDGLLYPMDLAPAI